MYLIRLSAHAAVTEACTEFGRLETHRSTFSGIGDERISSLVFLVTPALVLFAITSTILNLAGRNRSARLRLSCYLLRTHVGRL